MHSGCLHIEEARFGAIMGPYTEHVIDQAHFSSFVTCKKSNTSTRHVIIDLIWPKNTSVNLGTDKKPHT